MIRGNEWLAQNDPAQAIASYREALEWIPESEDAFYNLGIAYARAGDAVAAEQHYRRALELDADYAEVHNNLGNLLAHAGRLKEAEDHFLEAIRLLPDFATAHNGLGMLYQLEGRSADAREHFEQAVQHDPRAWEAWFNIGQNRSDSRDWEVAAAAFREVLQLRPGFKPAQEALARVEGRIRLPAP